jgi:DNA-binding GntR family transcriptional regulator
MEQTTFGETRIDPLHDQNAFSFTKTAEKLGQMWETSFEDHQLRLPLREDAEEDNTLAQLEKRAHKALGLEAGDPFIVVVRVRSHDQQPQLIQRIYLRPNDFPQSFLQDHDFARESLVDIYEKYGYQLTSRNSTLTARMANLYETNELGIRLGKPVLVAEQELFAVDSSNGNSVLLEYLEATYVDWSYRIESRPAIQTDRNEPEQ